MRQRDLKVATLAALCRPDAPTAADLLRLASVVELTELPAGAVVTAAQCSGGWQTTVLSGELASTVPAQVHRAGSRVTHRPETALVALTDVALLTVADRDLPLVTAMAPRLLAPHTARQELLP